jgi:hypothetical protein
MEIIPKEAHRSPRTPLEAPHLNARLLRDESYPNIAYDAQEGLFWRTDKNQKCTRVLDLDEMGCIVCKLKRTQKNTNRRASVLAWEIINAQTVPKDHVVYFKNLDTTDICGYNLGLVSKVEYAHIKDAIDNTVGFVKLIPHATEVYSYKVRYKQGGFTTHQSFHDITAAKNFQRMLFINGTVLLSKYMVSA